MADKQTGWISAAAVALLLTCGGGYAVTRAHYHNHEATCTIRDKDRGNNDHGYRIYTEQCGTLTNEDQWLAGKTDSADVQGRLQVGHTYRLRIVGWRNSALSDFPNVVRVLGEVR